MSATVAKDGVNAKEQVKYGRDTKGRFVPGNSGGPGNPFYRRMAAMRKVIAEAVDEDDLKRITAAMKKKAEEGDTAAAKLIFQYAAGKPEAAADPDRVDVDEWQTFREHARPVQEMGEVMSRLPARVAYDMTSVAWPCIVEKGFNEPMLAGLHAMDERDANAAKNGKKPVTQGSASGKCEPAGVSRPGPLPTGDIGDPNAWLRELVGEATGHVDASVVGNGSPPDSKRGKRRSRKERKAAARART